MPFIDRMEAGRQLAEALRHLQGQDVVVLGLPRGGVPVAFEVAQALDVPLDVIVVRKLGLPYQPELAMGAVGEGDVLVLNERVLQMAAVSEAEIAEVKRSEQAELERRARRFRRDRRRLSLAGRTAVVVDDGIATGSTARAACQVARAQGAARVVLAVPVCSPDSALRLRGEVDEMVCLETPEWFFAVGQFYLDFRQVSDEQVVELLQRSAQAVPAPAAAAGADPSPGDRAVDEEVEVAAGPVRLAGHLTVPEHATGLVVFAHGSGSSRHSPRNRYVAGILQRSGLATLLFDLLTPQEEHSRAMVFDVELLAGRLAEVVAWVRGQPSCRHLPIGYFGASTGAAAALWAAAAPDADVAAVVSRGGRPDLAAPRLGEVRAATLLIVGGHDTAVLDLNRRAQALMRGENRLAVVPGATHLFEEPGTLDQAAGLARDWFVNHLVPAPQPSV
ncbi:phosphoribosyltransferase [Pseudonocardia acidicola]|uniref:Phosphoribosyltransferase n=1 Tax=Pseudonocardia acidicola TaxID=2724939 RepID=A0ABX1S9T2_9PSEU|nr:phosphoribosyltransferase [Pseudonocardia acidicola]NMH97637.1 phosphoribosyltransferase [Pseudonocardia acidicola]